jgi:PAS domain S-box-containing protein
VDPKSPEQPDSVHGLTKLFPLIFDSINEGVFTVDEAFRITSFNAAAERITGRSRENAVGRKCFEVFRASICQSGCALRKTLQDSRPHQGIRVDILNDEMARVPITVSTSVLKNENGRVIGGVEIFRDVSEVEQLRNELAGRHRFRDIIGESSAMREIFAVIPQVAESDAAVLITGSSGTGKELVAQAIHDLSSRESKPFIRVNCGALPDTLLESELFGYMKGAFTGAASDKLGRFQQANGGTLFLDEIGDVSPAFQVKLLRALEEGEIQALGGTNTIKVNVRLITATNRNLDEMVRNGEFREDLYYRIRVIPIALPPLKRRQKDIPLLVSHFIKLNATRIGRKAPRITRRAMRILYDYEYPGNVRELRNIIERAFVLSTDDIIDMAHLPPEVVRATTLGGTIPGQRRSRPSERKIQEATITDRKEQQDRPEVRRLLAILEENGWNRSTTAAALGMGRTTLWRRMKEYGLL